MHRPDEEDEEDLRAYANVFARLTTGAPPTPPKRREKLVKELRSRVFALAARVRDASVVRAERAREHGIALVRRLREESADRLQQVREQHAAHIQQAREPHAAHIQQVRERRAARIQRVREQSAAHIHRLREKGAARIHRVREEGAAYMRRLREEGAALIRRARSRVSNPVHWNFGWHRTTPRSPVPLHREPSIFVGLASFAFAFTVAWWTGGSTDEVRERKEAFVAEQAVPAVGGTLPTSAQPAAWDVGQVLRTPGASEAAQLAVVAELAKDSSEEATKALLAGVDSASLHVSMACLRALSGRSCDRVASDLTRRLEDPQWQRRAWAARVLGANDCAGAGHYLTERLAVEPDLRVQAQLQLAIDSLKEPGA
jgi:hypothetical protein